MVNVKFNILYFSGVLIYQDQNFCRFSNPLLFYPPVNLAESM